MTTDARATQLYLQLEGFEGPLDLLLELARTQKVDLQHIALLPLAQQYLTFIEQARKVQLELAADWLVMAAWLTWLKSRLLLPQLQQDEEAGEAGEQLQERLVELEAMQAAGRWLEARPRLGRDVFARAHAEDHTLYDRSMLLGDLSALVSSYLSARRRTARRKKTYTPTPLRYWTVQQARSALARLLGVAKPRGWQALQACLPENLDDLTSAAPIQARAARAGLLVAGLELAKSGALELRQTHPFGPIDWRGRGA